MSKAQIDLLEYQDWVETKWIRSEDPLIDEIRIMTGMMGELGEVMEKVKKFHRDGTSGQKLRADLMKESGDFMYYFAKFCNMYDIDLDGVLMMNVVKLEDRAERGVIQGSGDDR